MRVGQQKGTAESRLVSVQPVCDKRAGQEGPGACGKTFSVHLLPQVHSSWHKNGDMDAALDNLQVTVAKLSSHTGRLPFGVLCVAVHVPLLLVELGPG